MIDLDSLAEKRAKALNQDVEAWRQLLWSPDFQSLSQSLTDGELEQMLDLCSTVDEVRVMIGIRKKD